MRDTERRIKEYQTMLPYLRAKVMSVALFLVISIVMMTSATFAWLTVSRSPEITGIETTVAANGNLEIALSKSDGSEPSESAVGDANLELTLRNLTWGNLVNLSDPSYGLDEIVLRPASLNTSSLLTSPLFAAKYSEDGRIEDLTSEFAYSNYDTSTEMFIVPGTTQYGVRAISSVTYTFAGGQKIFVERLQDANSKLSMAKNQYSTLTGNNDNMTAISSIMGDYLTDRFNGTKTDYQQYIPQMYSMLQEFDACMETTGEAIVRIANLQSMLAKGSAATTYTLDTLLAASDTELKDSGVSIEGLALYKSDRTKFETHMTTMEGIYNKVKENGTAVYWSELNPIVNFLVYIDSVEVDGLAVSKIGADEAAGMVLGGGDHVAVIKEGALFNMEQRLGTYMFAEDLPVTVTYKVTLTLYADVYTDAAPAAILQKEIDNVKNSNSGELVGTDPVAADTYGMAIDFWVRSNAANDYLLLEGNVLTTKVQKTDDQGNKYFTDIDTGAVVVQAKDGKYYDVDGKEVSGDNLSITYETIVIGYEGENRVWDDEILTENSTTQGGGSCYVFYADTPQDQAQSLEILAAMTVVFIDEKGKLLAYAEMDTNSYYAESGRVTVPMRLRSTSMNLGQDEEGNDVYAITALEKGKAKRITALIYVDGTKVTNTAVLADGNIQGKLNLQFGSYVDMEALSNDEVHDQEIHISGSATPNSFDFATTTDLKSTVTLNITGVTPNKVEANFIRQINSTQGSRQKTITFTKKSDGVYTAEMEFSAPGDYVLRTVWLDGVEYRLDAEIPVKITGFAISNVGWQYSNNYAKVMSAESYVAEAITVQFSGNNGIQRNKVQGIFSNAENQQITVNFKKGTTNWGGTAQFATSGVYTMKYLLVDGEYYEIPSNMKKTIDLSLGMRAKVQISKTVLEKFTGNPPETLSVYATVMDNKGNPLTGLENVSIQYLAQGSGLTENGLYSKLTWNGTANRYEGEFSVKVAGAYEFGYLTIGSSSINSAEAPVITAIPPVPPSYYGNLTEKNIFAYGADVSMRIALADSSAIADGKTIAVLEKLDEDGNVVATIKVSGVKAAHIEEGIDNVMDWVFTIPTTEELETTYGYTGVSQLGDWRMTELSIIGAYVDGVISTEENPMIIDVSDKDIETKINDEMTVVVSGEGQELSTDKLFLESNTVTEGLVVKVRGAGGEEIDPETIEYVKVTYQLDVNSLTYTNSTTSAGYYYTSTDELATLKANLASNGTTTVELMVNPSNSTEFILDSANGMTLPIMGTYKLNRVMFKIGEATYATTVAASETGSMDEVPLSEDSAAPSYTYEWDAPIVTVTGKTPNSSNVNIINDEQEYLNWWWRQRASITVMNNNTSTYSATVYFSASTEVLGWPSYATIVNSYTIPTVTTNIGNVSTFNDASMIVYATGTTDITPRGTCGNITFSYTSSKRSDIQSIGHVGSTVTTNRYILGNNSKGTHIKISGTTGNNTITYVFKLDNAITINNPY